MAKFPFGKTGAITMKTIKARTTTPKTILSDWTVTKKDLATDDIGPGPWTYDGKIVGSEPEARILRALTRMGWTPEYQVNFLGGRQIPGGQVLDIVLNDHIPPIYIDVRSYYHLGAKAEFNDKVKEAIVKQFMPTARQIILWETEIKQFRFLENVLEREVGYHGRG